MERYLLICKNQILKSLFHKITVDLSRIWDPIATFRNDVDWIALSKLRTNTAKVVPVINIEYGFNVATLINRCIDQNWLDYFLKFLWWIDGSGVGA